MLDSITPNTRSIRVPFIEALFEYMRPPTINEHLCILALSNQKELNELITQRHLMRDVQLVLILPDDSDQMLSQAHLLLPRFISRENDKLSELKAVIEKIMIRMMLWKPGIC
jgi:hypothetical protein